MALRKRFFKFSFLISAQEIKDSDGASSSGKGLEVRYLYFLFFFVFTRVQLC